MKILIATDGYKYNTGGVTASILALCSGLRRKGHEVKILSPSNCLKSFRDGDDYFIKSVPAFYYPDMRIALSINDPLLKELEAWHPDIIHAQTEGSAYIMAKRIMKRCGAPLIMTCHTDYAHFVFGRLKGFPPVKAIMCGTGKILYHNADKVIAPSQKASDFAFLHSMQERMAVIPNGMELEKYQKTMSASERGALRKSLGIDDNTKVLVSVCRLSKEKNIRELIAFLPSLINKMPDVKLLLVGDGPDRSYLEKQTEKLNLKDNIIFTGRVPAEDVWRYYNLGDVFVSASTFEVHSMSYLEALSQGLPMLCRADDALTGVLEHGYNGMIYHSREEFAEFAQRMLCDDSLRENMKQNSLKKAKDFSSDAFADSVLQLYKEAITENGKSEFSGKGVIYGNKKK
ncbi:MAG: glycosyltransferase [Clostridia bacterium]|nr:glycosyltransferase [Clostridia bacterium]